MPQELTGYADFGVLGLTIIALMLALAWAVRQWIAALHRIEGMHEARLLAEREHGKIGEAMRDTMMANTTALQAATKVMEHSTYRGRDAA